MCICLLSLDQRSEVPSSQGSSADLRLCKAVIQDEQSDAKQEVDHCSKPLSHNDLEAVIQSEQRTDSIFGADSQQTIFPTQPVPQSKESRLVLLPGVAPKVSDAVMTPLGQGIVRMTYPDGRFGVAIAGGFRFSAVSASEITVLGFS